MAKLKKKSKAKKILHRRVKKIAKRRKVLIVKSQSPRGTRKPKFQMKKRKQKVRKLKKAKIRKPARKARIKVSKKSIKKRLIKAKKKTVSHKSLKRIKKHKVVKLRKFAVKKRTKRPTRISSERFPVESLFKAKIKVIGVGGGGGSIVSEIGRSLEKATFVIADTDIRALKKRSGIKYFWFGQDLTHGLGTGVNVDLAKQAAESAKEKISSFFEDQDIIIFVASLGGGIGSGATQVFAEAARGFGGIAFGIFTMPFKFEGKNKQRIAQNALKSLRRSLNVSLVIPNEKIFKIIDESTPITQAFSTVNKSLIESLESLIDLIYSPGIINIDFADLRTILNGRGNSAFLNTIEESGKNRVEKICENIFKNPLLQSSSFKTEKILFNIEGSENLSMFEVEKISNHIATVNPKAKIIFGISKNSKLKNKIKTTILMTGALPGFQIEKEAHKENLVSQVGSAKPVAREQTQELPAKDTKTNKKNKPQKTSAKRSARKAPKTKKTSGSSKNQQPVSFIPVFEAPSVSIPVLEQKGADIVQAITGPVKKTIRRSGLEIKKAEELQEKKRIAQEKEWEIPAFLRKIKFKS